MEDSLPQTQVRGAPDLAGKYRLIAELGQGGMATVYLAVVLGKSGFRKLAVVKLLRPEIGVDSEFVQMFLDEAKLCARLSHPNIVHIYDVGVDDVGHLMAMEYLDGVSLHAATSKLARNGGPFSFAVQAKVLREVVEGLRYAHELQDYDGRPLEIVHRDVTPHNIFVTYDGQVKLLDFGIAKAATSSVRTATGVIKGKLTYMAPEQARGEFVDARADLYAVGVMLLEAVTGKRRWPAGLSQPALFTRLAAGETPERPNAASLGYPAEIDDIVIKALAPKPEDRYQSAAELAEVLDKVLRQLEPVSLRELGGMLSKAFAEGRQRLHDVIEEQFRAMDSGTHQAAEPRQLPAIAPVSIMTGSDAHDRPSSGETEMLESLSIRMTAPALEQSTLSQARLRSRVAIGAAATTAAAAALIIAIVATRGHAPDAPATASPPGSATTAANLPPVPSPPWVEPAADTQSRTPSTAVTVEGNPTPDGRRNRFVSPGLPNASGRRAPGAASASTVPTSANATTSPSPTAAEASTGEEALPLRRPGEKPKVQLERDNPFQSP